jgi:hypothetical protein
MWIYINIKHFEIPWLSTTPSVFIYLSCQTWSTKIKLVLLYHFAPADSQSRLAVLILIPLRRLLKGWGFSGVEKNRHLATTSPRARNAIIYLVQPMAAPPPAPHGSGGSDGSSSYASSRRRLLLPCPTELRWILIAPQPTTAPPPAGGAAGSIPTKEERMRMKKGKLVKTLKVKTEISGDVKYLRSFLFVL